MKTLVKSTCKWFAYLWNRNKLLSFVISLVLNREPVLACEHSHNVAIHTWAMCSISSLPLLIPSSLTRLPYVEKCVMRNLFSTADSFYEMASNGECSGML